MARTVIMLRKVETTTCVQADLRHWLCSLPEHFNPGPPVNHAQASRHRRPNRLHKDAPTPGLIQSLNMGWAEASVAPSPAVP